jgi:hypothetical protein
MIQTLQDAHPRQRFKDPSNCDVAMDEEYEEGSEEAVLPVDGQYGPQSTVTRPGYRKTSESYIE